MEDLGERHIFHRISAPRLLFAMESTDHVNQGAPIVALFALEYIVAEMREDLRHFSACQLGRAHCRSGQAQVFHARSPGRCSGSRLRTWYFGSWMWVSCRLARSEQGNLGSLKYFHGRSPPTVHRTVSLK
jgi:hypothetical protein